MDLLTMFVFKLLDGALGTMKNIFLVKNRKFLSALASAVSQFFYLVIVVRLAKATNMEAIVVVCAATFVGSYLPLFIAEKREKDRVFVYDITPDSNENGKEFADQVRDSNLAVTTYKGYNGNREQVLCCKIFSQSKAESRMIEEIIPQTFTYIVFETRNRIAS